MTYKVNHIHLKSKNPEVTAEWFVNAFNVKIISDTHRPIGDRFIVTEAEGGMKINISSERTNEILGPADSDAHYGLEHFGFDSEDINKDIERLVSMGAELKEGPREVEGGPIIAFISAPGDIRIELIQSR